MPKIDNLVTDEKAAEVKVPLANGEEVTLNVTPGKMKGDVMVGIAEATDEAAAYLMVMDVLVECIESWDITHDVPVSTDVEGDEGGEPATIEMPLPITRENITAFPIGFVMETFRKMQEAVDPQSKKESSFGNG